MSTVKPKQALPDLTDIRDPATRRALEQMRAIMQELLGRNNGDGSTELVTHGELQAMGLAGRDAQGRRYGVAPVRQLARRART